MGEPNSSKHAKSCTNVGESMYVVIP